MDVEGGGRAKAIQGHSPQTVAAATEAAGLEPDVGRAYRVEDDYFSQDLLHGTNTGDAAYIYRDGLLVGGLDEHRAHVHLVHAIGEWTDESRGGIRC